MKGTLLCGDEITLTKPGRVVRCVNGERLEHTKRVVGWVGGWVGGVRMQSRQKTRDVLFK